MPPQSLAHQHSLAQLVPRCSLPIFASSCVARFRPGTRSSLAAARQGLHFPCGFAGCKVSGPFRDRPRVHRRRDCARPSVLVPGRLRTGGHILPLSCPSASLSAVCGTVSAVKSRWQRKICARQIPKRCGRTLRKQVWVSAWTGNLPCFKPLCTVCTPCALL